VQRNDGVFLLETENKQSSIVNPIFEKHNSFIFNSFTKNQILTAKKKVQVQGVANFVE